MAAGCSVCRLRTDSINPDRVEKSASASAPTVGRCREMASSPPDPTMPTASLVPPMSTARIGASGGDVSVGAMGGDGTSGAHAPAVPSDRLHPPGTALGPSRKDRCDHGTP